MIGSTGQRKPKTISSTKRHDVVGNRVQPHGDDAHQLEAAALLVVAGEPAEQVAEPPGE